MPWTAGIRLIVGGFLVVTGLPAGVIAVLAVGQAVFALEVAGGVSPAAWLTAFAGFAIWVGWLTTVGLTTWYFWWRRSSASRSVAVGVVQLVFCGLAFASGAGLTYLVFTGS